MSDFDLIAAALRRQLPDFRQWETPRHPGRTPSRQVKESRGFDVMEFLLRRNTALPPPGQKFQKAKIPPGALAKAKAVMLSSTVPSAPPAQPDYVDLTKKVGEAIFEIIYMSARVVGLISK